MAYGRCDKCGVCAEIQGKDRCGWCGGKIKPLDPLGAEQKLVAETAAKSVAKKQVQKPKLNQVEKTATKIRVKKVRRKAGAWN